MSYQFILSFLMTFVFTSLTIVIYTRYQDRITIATTFNVLVASFVLWSGAMAMFYYQTDKSLLLFWSKAQFFTGSLVATSVLLFSFLYPSEKFSITIYQRVALFIPNVIIYYLCFFTPSIVQDISNFNGTIGWVKGPYAFVWHLYFVGAVFLAFLRFFRKYKDASGTIKERLRYLLAGMYSGLFLSAIPSVLMPWFFDRFELYWLGGPLTFSWVVFLAYIVFKKPLMEIPTFLQNSLLYSLLVALLALLQFSLVTSFKNLFPGLSNSFDLFPLIGSLVLIVAILFPLRNFLSAFIEKFIFSENYFKVVKENEYLRKEMAQSEKYKSLATLFSRIIFEIKNPLTTLKGYSYCLPQKLGDEKFLNEFSQILRDEIDRINNLVNHLTEYSRPTSLSAKDVDMQQFIDETISMLKNSFQEEKINVIKKYQDSEPVILRADPKQLRQAFLNIIVNAIDAMGEGGDLWIRAGKGPDHFRIIVCDSGTGIPKDKIGRAFEPFFSLKDHNPGLGLSVALGIIENHGGTIHIESEEAVGTEVTIELPMESNLELTEDVIRIG